MYKYDENYKLHRFKNLNRPQKTRNAKKTTPKHVIMKLCLKIVIEKNA